MIRVLSAPDAPCAPAGSPSSHLMCCLGRGLFDLR